MARYSKEGLEKIRKVNEARFLRGASAKFNDRFDYSHAAYQRQKSSVVIVCPKHGRFSQTPDKHLQSTYGCPKCGGNVRSESRKRGGKQRFNETFKLRFGDRLEVISPYVSVKSPIRIRCKIHNLEFDTTPDRLNALAHGCLECANESTGRAQKLNKQEIIERILVKYGDQFSLAKAKFDGLGKKVTLICPVHDEFLMSPNEFLQSTYGCPKCGRLHSGYASNRIQRLEQGLIKPQATTLALMKIAAFEITGYKLGTTSRTLMSRYGEALREILFETTLDELDALKLEQYLHGKYFRWRDLRIFLAGLRAGKRWSGDSEIYKEQCIPNILQDLREAVAAFEAKDFRYWERLPKLVPPILRIRVERKKPGVFNRPKAVIRLDTREIFPSATAAARAIGSTQGLVSAVCNGKRGHTKGIRLAYLGDFEAEKVPKFVSRIGEHDPRARAVRCIDTNTVFPTVSAAAKNTGIHSGKIVAVCKGRRRIAGGLRWSYAH